MLKITGGGPSRCGISTGGEVEEKVRVSGPGSKGWEGGSGDLGLSGCGLRIYLRFGGRSRGKYEGGMSSWVRARGSGVEKYRELRGVEGLEGVWGRLGVEERSAEKFWVEDWVLGGGEGSGVGLGRGLGRVGRGRDRGVGRGGGGGSTETGPATGGWSSTTP